MLLNIVIKIILLDRTTQKEAQKKAKMDIVLRMSNKWEQITKLGYQIQ